MKLHPNNPHHGQYDFTALGKSEPALLTFLRTKPDGGSTIDFSDSNAVQCLNKAILAHYYHIQNWSIPDGYLCPPVPGRADYIHNLADLINELSATKPVKVMDIGTGANLIYPLLGVRTFRWQFIATDIDSVALTNAEGIIRSNPMLKGKIRLFQQQPGHYFSGALAANERVHATLCNPPFFESQQQAQLQTQRKWKSLKGERSNERNFGGRSNELWCQGGERRFLLDLIQDSRKVKEQVGWFTTLVSRKKNLPILQNALKAAKVAEEKVLVMQQGQKTSHLLAWRYRESWCLK